MKSMCNGMEDLFDSTRKMGDATIPKSIILTEDWPGWYFNFDNDAISYAGILGLPRMSYEGKIMICLPIVYRKYYEKSCEEYGVTLVWEQTVSAE